ncbi:MAG TPA: type II toxin-antitoxin system Phd/YefM family antitoxin [Steroidobacteraceae bacterium]|jgi:prevent-host-death family protein|nr:type II toxin-antitoxin system Phd/YefM family antitoxin [Steroidobacteraceae bacterium]
MDIPAAQFKAECLKLMDQVEKTREPIVITKHGRPVAQLAPIAAEPESLFGYMKDTLKITGDVSAPIDVEWSAKSGDEDQLYKAGAAKPRRKK